MKLQIEDTTEAPAAGLDYAHAPVGRLFMKIFIPTLLGMIFIALITIVDGIFVGRGVGPDGIAAVNIVAPLYMVATGVGLMLGIGASVVAGMSLAKGGAKIAGRVVWQAFAAGTVLMGLLTAVVLLWPERTARILGSSDHLMPHALDYLCWLIPCVVFLTWQSIGLMTIRLDGSPKYSMMCNVGPAVLNIAGDYVLIFPCGMGVKGAAVATACSVAVGGIMVLVYFRKPYVIRLSASLQGVWHNLGRTCGVGSSALITEVAMSVMMLTGNYVFMRYFGDAGVAAYSIACYLFPLMFMMSNAVAQSAQPIISYNAGADAYGRVGATFRLSLRVAACYGALAFIAIALLAPKIVGMFIPVDSQAGMLASGGLPIFSSCAIFFALNIAFIGYFQSVEMAVRAILLTLLRGVVLLVPLFFLVPAIWPEWGMWAAIPAAEALALAVIILTSRPLLRHNKPQTPPD